MSLIHDKILAHPHRSILRPPLRGEFYVGDVANYLPTTPSLCYNRNLNWDVEMYHPDVGWILPATGWRLDNIGPMIPFDGANIRYHQAVVGEILGYVWFMRLDKVIHRYGTLGAGASIRLPDGTFVIMMSPSDDVELQMFIDGAWRPITTGQYPNTTFLRSAGARIYNTATVSQRFAYILAIFI